MGRVVDDDKGRVPEPLAGAEDATGGAQGEVFLGGFVFVLVSVVAVLAHFRVEGTDTPHEGSHGDEGRQHHADLGAFAGIGIHPDGIHSLQDAQRVNKGERCDEADDHRRHRP